MEPAMPLKPPRGVKQYKDPSGLLMSVIRTLSKSETDEQRDKQKSRLEKDYKESNKKLEELVSKHDEQLTQVMQLFVTVSSHVTASREKIRAVKSNLEACKSLLRYRRDELKKLWQEGLEHKHSLQLLEEIDELREVPSQLGVFLAKKQYLHATQLLTSALSLGDGNLEGVEALTDVRNELHVKKQMLHGKLMEELKQHLYVLPTTDALAFRRQGSGREALSPFQRGAIGDQRGSNRGSRARRKLVEGAEGAVQDVQEDVEELDGEERTEYWMGIVIECLGLLHKIPDSIDSLKEEMQAELIAIVSRATRSIIETSQTLTLTSEGGVATIEAESTKQQRLLLELLETVLDQLRRVAAAHSIALRCYSKTAEKYRLAVRLYEMADVWSKIQAVLQQVLSDYLDVPILSGNQLQATHFTEPTTDISSFFSKRKPQRSKKAHLFRFDYSSHALAMSPYSASTPGTSRKTGNRERQLVCPPDMHNVTVVFIPLNRFVQEVESTLHSSPCTLRTFMEEYVADVFVKQTHHKVTVSVEVTTKAPDAWKTVISPEHTKKLGLSRPLLESTVVVERRVVELRQLLKTLPAFADKFLSILYTMLKHYLEVCQAAYRGIVQPDSEDKRICSAAWLKDDDISRFIKSLPNWMELQAYKPTHRRGRTIRREETTEEESPEDIRQRNVKEAEILASNMGEGGISAHEILSDVGQLKKLAQLHESMEWFAAQVLSIKGDVTHLNETDSHRRIPDSALEKLFELIHGFTGLADICLLVLHLEVRVQCFHYLLPKLDRTTSRKYDFLDPEPDPNVLELSKVLINIDEAMVSSIQPRKTKYVFEGLGHLIAKILISSSQYMEVMNEPGIQRMCRNIFALQQTLTNITAAREVALDHAKQYYELFYKTPEEILTTVLDKGPQFTDMEYINAFQLIGRSHPDKYPSVEKYLQRLSDILGEIGVTV